MAANEALTPRVFIVRHGETEWAKIGRQTGKTELDLTTGGMEQIQATANHLVGPQRLLDPNKIARIYVSPRKRTQQTMIALLSEHQDLVDEERGVVVKTDDVAEWDFGEYEGLFLKEIRVGRKSRGLDVGTVWNVWRDGCEGGENKDQATERLDRVIAEIREIQRPCMRGEKPADVLVVSHGVILRAFVMRWLGYPVDMPLNMMLPPGAVAVLSYKNNSIDEPAFYMGMALPPEGDTEA